MAITTLAGVEAGLTAPNICSKGTSNQANSSSQWITSFYVAGFPIAATAPTPGISGDALTSYAGQIPFTNPASGNTYLAGFRKAFFSSAVSASQRTTMLVDRLWHNSDLDRTSITAQTVNSVAWPARDINGSTNGEGVYLAIEISTTMGTGAPTITVSYTNSAGTAGRTGVSFLPTRASAPAGHWFPIGLEEGDTGVRSVQSVTFSVSWGSAGVLHLVAYRPIAMINAASMPANYSADDALTLAVPQLWDDSVLQTVAVMAGNGAADSGPILVQYTQG
jgi:hypothetical protein